MSKEIKLFAPAKINLFLEVLGKRENGYHNIISILQTISLYDEIWIKPDIKLKVTCNLPELSGKKNIVYRASELLCEGLKMKAGASIYIKKNIPILAGLGGGSSDAATVMLGLLKLWNKKVGKEKLIEISKDVGADVPFFIYGGCCIAKGIGEKLKPIKPFWYKKPLDILLIIPNVKIPTKVIYENINLSSENKKRAPIDLQNRTKGFFKKLLFNRLEDVTLKLYPELLKIKNEIKNLGFDMISMTGSGPTFFVILNQRNIRIEPTKDYSIKLVQTIFPNVHYDL